MTEGRAFDHSPVDLSVVAICQILKEIPPALKQAQARADSSSQLKLARECGAAPTGPGKFKKQAKGFEKFDTDN